jgi:TRAP-type C4-dicarboxylate transport system permease large subunit
VGCLLVVDSGTETAASTPTTSIDPMPMTTAAVSAACAGMPIAPSPTTALISRMPQPAKLIGTLVANMTIAEAATSLHDAIAITGALFFLLMAATTFTLVLRLLGTDRLVNNLVVAIPGGELPAVIVVLGVIGLCAFVLDAFEIIFVILPIMIPPLLIRVADARWVSVLVLLTLQSSFLLPPFGYALMMVRGAAKDPAPLRPFVRALIPFLVAQWLFLVVVLLVPGLVHVGEKAGDISRAPSKELSTEEIYKLLREMMPGPPVQDAR